MVMPPGFDQRLERIAWFLKNWEQGDRNDVALCAEARELAGFVCGEAPELGNWRPGYFWAAKR